MKALLCAGTALLVVPSFASAQGGPSPIGTAYCSGDGCPCGNENPAGGCGNLGIDGDPETGARMFAEGSPVVASDDLALVAEGLQAGAQGLFFMGEARPSIPFGDGLLCVTPGSSGIFRYGTSVADNAGVMRRTNIVSQSQLFQGGAIVVGATWAFQAFYRDIGGPCGNQFNLTNALSITFEAPAATAPREVDLVGRTLGEFPWFERFETLNQGDALEISLDGSDLSAGTTVDLWVVATRTAAEWAADPTLVDVRGASQAYTVVAGGAQANRVVLDAGTLNGTDGVALGVGYDVIVDVDRDGFLGSGDRIDGGGDAPGCVIARDTTAVGPYDVTQFLFNGGSLRRQKIYHPTNIADLGQQPLVVISHGNGHNYQWYDYLGEHLASYGYVVMSHENNTMPGIETASQTTLLNTDTFLTQLPNLSGGILDGHVDSDRIAWIGHSRGGEGVARAYDRLLDANYVPNNYGPSNIRLISSMAPTVFLGIQNSNPAGSNFHLWVGSADDDVNGGVAPPTLIRSFPLHERATATRMATVLQGAGHAVFHSGTPGLVADGPCLISKDEAHPIIRAHFVALLAHFVREEPGAKDFLVRPYESLAPIGSPEGPCIVVSHEYRDGPLAGDAVIDDYQSEDDPSVSSSGQSVTGTVTALAEGRMGDENGTMSHDPSDPFNGFTRVKGNPDNSRGEASSGAARRSCSSPWPPSSAT